MSVRAFIAVAGASLVSLACAHPSAPRSADAWGSPPLYASPPPPSAPTIDDVSRARGLPAGAQVVVQTLDHEAFVRALRKNEKASELGAQFADLFLSTLTMAKPQSGAGAAAQKQYDEDVAGFYDPSAKTLYLRSDTNQKASSYALTLAHEEEHALQDRFFGIPEFAKLGNVDEALASKALFEGDATLTSTMMQLAHAGMADAVTLAVLTRLRDEDFVKTPEKSRDGEQIPAMARATTSWPYQRGTTFAAQLAESGGWELLDAALRDPPKTTEQVLHVEKYIAGERAIEVRAAEAPDGYMSVERGRMGELQTRYFLAECVAQKDANDAASGWGGDSFLIATQGSRNALLWSTAWDDDAAAARFFDALQARKACASEQKPPFVALRDGTRVAFVQGLDDDRTRTGEARKLLALAGRATSSLPPFGAVSLALHPPIPIDFAHRGHIEHGRFVDAALGIESDLGALKAFADPGYELLATNGSARVGLAFRWAPPSASLRDSFLDALVDAVRKGYRATKVFDLGTSRVDVAGTSLEARSVRADDKREVRLALLPACGGRMTIALVTSWQPGSAADLAVADAWLKTLRTSDSSPACEAMKNLRVPTQAR